MQGALSGFGVTTVLRKHRVYCRLIQAWKAVFGQVTNDDLPILEFGPKPLSDFACKPTARGLSPARARFDNENLVQSGSLIDSILTFCALILFRKLIITNKAL
jgi:hypothetical protein